MRTIPFLAIAMGAALAARGGAFSAEPLEAKVPDFTYQLNGALLKLIPPKDHHFNVKAPSRVQLGDKDLALDAKEPGIAATLPVPHAAGTVTASAYVCDRAKTYCVMKALRFDVPALEKADGTPAGSAPSATGPAVRRKHATRKGTDKETGFIFNDFQRALRTARKSGKPLMIDFFGIWCPPCNRLDESVFRTGEFRKGVASRMVLLALDSDEAANAALKEKYRIQGLPTLVFATPEGDEITRLIGFHPLEEIEQAAVAAVARKSEGLGATAARATGGDAEARYRAAEIALGRGEAEKALEWVEPLMAALKASGDGRIQLIHRAELQAALAKQDGARARSVLKEWLSGFPQPSVDRLENLQKLADLDEEAGDAPASRASISAAVEVARELASPEGAKLLKGTEYSVADLDETLGELFSRLGEGAKAKEAYERCAEDFAAEARKAKTDFARGAALERSYCLSEAGKVDESEALLREATRRYPGEFTFHLQLAKLLLERRKTPEGALAEAESALAYAYGGQRLKAVMAKAKALDALNRPVPAIRAIDEELAAPIVGTPSPGALLLRKKLADMRSSLAKKLAN